MWTSNSKPGAVNATKMTTSKEVARDSGLGTYTNASSTLERKNVTKLLDKEAVQAIISCLRDVDGRLLPNALGVGGGCGF
ncbi:hypothetical protein ACHAWF_005691 [Thalassiosira exigua]